MDDDRSSLSDRQLRQWRAERLTEAVVRLTLLHQHSIEVRRTMLFATDLAFFGRYTGSGRGSSDIAIFSTTSSNRQNRS